MNAKEAIDSLNAIIYEFAGESCPPYLKYIHDHEAIIRSALSHLDSTMELLDLYRRYFKITAVFVDEPIISYPAEVETAIVDRILELESEGK